MLHCGLDLLSRGKQEFEDLGVHAYLVLSSLRGVGHEGLMYSGQNMANQVLASTVLSEWD